MAHQSTSLTEVQREAALKARDGFLAETRTPLGDSKKKWQEARCHNRAVRVAIIQTPTGALEETDAERNWVPPQGNDEAEAARAGKE